MNKQQLANKIWASANKMRSKIEANEYKDYILGLIFYKFLSDNEVNYLNSIGWTDEDIVTLVEDHENQEAVMMMEYCRNNIGYFIEYQNLFATWLKPNSEFSVADLSGALSSFDRLISPHYKHVYENIFKTLQAGLSKLGENPASQTRAIKDLIKLIKDIPTDGRQDYDVLGYVYEYLISNFAANAGKKAGEFYTPQEVSRILAEIVSIGHQRLRNVYDPTCGSGSLLLRAASIGNAVDIYGQEKNPTTYNLARMNMLLHGIRFSNFKIENGDTLEWDAFGDTQFDAVVANPPFSAEWSAADKFNTDDRFSKAGRLAPKKTADYAFILHMIYHLNEGGTMACVAPHGVLFRGNAEGVIRRFLIEKKNYVDAIIGLPANIFYGTSIPTCILVFKKCRKEDDNILFIDASKEFEKVKTQNKLREQHIQKIVETYRDRKEIEKYSHLASLQEIAENDYNLNIPRYVDTFEEEEPIDIKAVMAEIKELEAKRAELDKEIEVYLKELGLVE